MRPVIRRVGLVLTLGGVALALCRWLNLPHRPAIFHSYTDNAFAMWGLTLYRDGGFDETLPGSYESGRFELTGDTVVLHYAGAGPLPPAAYCIGRLARKIYKLGRGAGRWLADDTGRDWSQIWLDSLRPGPAHR